MGEKIQHLEELLSVTPSATKRHRDFLSRLAERYETKSCHTNDISDFEPSIKYGRLELDATHRSDLSRCIPFGTLRKVLLHAFRHTNKTNYLAESIILGYDMLKFKGASTLHVEIIQQLLSCLLTRSRLLGRIEGRHEAIRLMDGHR
jgi:hypothetical protein